MGSISAAGLAVAAPSDWIELLNGHDLKGWRSNGNADSWKVSGGALVGSGPTSHLFYTGRVHNATFRNFELMAEIKTAPQSNSGMYFHTAWQSGFPVKGFEVRINNTYAGPDRGERIKTGSLYGLRNIYKQLAPDDQWFQMQISVRGKNVQIRLDGQLVVDYVEPTPPVIPDGAAQDRFLDQGTFALQCHNTGPAVMYRSVRVRPLADDLPAASPMPVVDDVFRKVIQYGQRNIPMVDFHVHLKEGLTLDQALAKFRRDGIFYGIAINGGKGFPIENDEGVRNFFESMKGQPIFIAMQAEGREWTKMFSEPVAALFDYVFTDSMTWTDNNGKRMRLWIPEEVGAIPAPQAFMDQLVERTVGILEREPIDIYVNPTFLPDVLAPDYDRLWSEERMHAVIAAAVKNKVAIEMNNRYRIPSARFVSLAKAAGCKFTMGTNNSGPKDLGRCEYALGLIEECQLEWQDFFVPQVWWPKAVERKAGVLRG